MGIGFKLIKKNAYFIGLFFAYSLTNTAEAQTAYRASKLFHLPGASSIYRGEFPILNDSTIIYPLLDNPASKIRVFAHNLNSKETTLVYSSDVDLTPPNHYNIKLQIEKNRNGSKAFIVFDTKLIITDGSAAGTKLLHNFNDNIPDDELFRGVSATAISTIDNHFYYMLQLSYSDGGLDLEISPSLWRSDGTTSGTKKIVDFIADSSSYPYNSYFNFPPTIRGPFRHSNGEMLFDYDAEGISKFYRLSQSGNAIESSAPQLVGGDTRTQIITTRRGSFFCHQDRTGSNAHSNNLWRLNTDLTLTKIEEKCSHLGGLYNVGDDIYFATSEGIHHTNGIVGQATRIYTFENDNYHVGMDCVIKGNLYLTLNQSRRPENDDYLPSLFYIKPDNTVSEVNDGFNYKNAYTEIVACLDNGVITRTRDDDLPDNYIGSEDHLYIHGFLDTETKRLYQIVNGLSKKGFPVSNASPQDNKSFIVPGPKEPFWLTPYTFPSPSIMMMLGDD